MRFFVLNIFLAMTWTLLQGQLRALDFIAGFVLGYVVIGLSQRLLGSGNYSQKVVQVVRFVAFVAWDIFTASLALAWLMLQPKPKLSPAVIAIPLDVKTDLEIVLLANLITLSPGTLSVDVSSDNSTLYVHTINQDRPDEFRAEIKGGLERRVLEVMR
jgi:multicomponent Na+:H+ antiporter subunit E